VIVLLDGWGNIVIVKYILKLLFFKLKIKGRCRNIYQSCDRWAMEEKCELVRTQVLLCILK